MHWFKSILLDEYFSHPIHAEVLEQLDKTVRFVPVISV
jgi:hypothetical protein